MRRLYNSVGKMPTIGKSWTELKAESFGAPSFEREEDKVDFVLLEMGGDRKGHFIPFGEGENSDIRSKAEDILEEARKRAAGLEREAYEKGFVQGEKDGLELGKKKAIKLIENVENLLAELSYLRKEFPKQYEKEILEIVFAIAKKVINLQIESDKRVIEETIFKAIELACEKGKIILKVNPEDLEYVEELRPGVISKFKEIKGITVSPEPSITRGGCILETPYGDVDARIESQLENLRECLAVTFAEMENE